MITALKGVDRIYPSPGDNASCPSCGAEVIAKCGSINVWHWAHRSRDCDSWTEPISDWHVRWQQHFPEQCREVVIGWHRCDIRLPGGIIELQHSPISEPEIRAREDFYGRMLWIFDTREAYESSRLELRSNPSRRSDYRSFRWKHPRRSIRACKRPVYLDIGRNRMLRLEFLGKRAPYGGFGYIMTIPEFLESIIIQPGGKAIER